MKTKVDRVYRVIPLSLTGARFLTADPVFEFVAMEAKPCDGLTTARRDFGSFHSSNVQELIELPDSDYIPPTFPFDVPTFEDEADSIQFGKPCREQHFLLEEACTFINHGAFGGVLKDALDIAQKWQRYIERQPLRFFDRELLPHLVYVTRRLANFVGCSPRDLVLVTNATTAINAVVRSIPLQPHDCIYILSVTYGAVKKLIRQVCKETQAVLQEETVTFPVTGDEQIISLVKHTLKQDTKLAIFDHIPSNSPFILPIKEIIQVCHDRNVPVLIDGAHSLGALPLDLKSLGADYYVSNAHKWFCCPKGAAFLYVKKDLQSSTRPLIISHGFGSGFNSEFIWAGLHDYSPFLAMHVTLNFWTAVGVSRIHKYMYSLCRDAGKYLTKKWNTQLGASEDMFGSMTLVELPRDLYDDKSEIDYSTAELIQNRLYHGYNIEVPVKSIQGVLYVRISCHIYNEISQYERLGEAILDMLHTTTTTTT